MHGKAVHKIRAHVDRGSLQSRFCEPRFQLRVQMAFCSRCARTEGRGQEKEMGFCRWMWGGGEGDEVAVSQHQAMKKSGFTKSSGLGCAPPHTHTHSGGGE